MEKKGETTKFSYQFVGSFNFEMVVKDQETMKMRGVASLIVCQRPKMNVVFEGTYSDDPEKIPEIEFYQVLLQRLLKKKPEVRP